MKTALTVPGTIYHVILFGRDIMPVSILTKFREKK